MIRRSLISALLLAAFTACTPAQSSPETIGASEGPRDYRTLVAQLRQAGLAVESAGPIEQTFFTPQANVIRIGDLGEAQVYEYPTATQAEAEAASVNANGSIGTSMPMWIAPPHFFRSGSLLVLYLGSDERTLSTLRRLLGEPFAGGR